MTHETGKIVTVEASQVVAKDGNTYDVFTVHASGRGWSNKLFYTTGLGVAAKPLEVQIMPDNGHNRKGMRLVKIIQDSDQEMFGFSKKPYVRKDGSFTVVQENTRGVNGEPLSYNIGMSNKYGVFCVKPDYWKDPAMSQRFEFLLDQGFITKDEQAFFMYLYF